MKTKIIGSSLILFNLLFGQKIFETFDLERKHRYSATTTYEFDIDTTKPIQFIIDKIQGDIYVRGTNNMTISIEEKISIKSRSRKDAETKFDRYRAAVIHHSNSNTVEVSGTGTWPTRMSYSYYLSLPVNISIRAHTSGGNIEAEYLTGEIDLKTSGGNLDLQDLEGKLTAKTAGGNIRLEHGIGNLYLSTSGGDITVTDIEGKLNVHTSGGDIDIENSHGNVYALTSGGNVNFKAIQGERIEGRTSGGDISGNEIIGKLIMKTSGGDLSAEDISGTVKGSTSGGDIELDNITGEIDITTSAGSIHGKRIQSGIYATTSAGDIYIEKSDWNLNGDHSITLKTSSGDIQLYIPGEFPAVIDARIRNGDNHFTVGSEFPLTITKTHNDVEAVGIIGTGNHRVKLRNSDGHITIKRN